VLSTRN